MTLGVRCPECRQYIPTVHGGGEPPCPYCGHGVPEGAPRPPVERGPAGKRRHAGLAALLSLVTFGVYPMLWLWWTGKESDTYFQRRHAARPMRAAVILFLAAFVLFVAANLVDLFTAGFIVQDPFKPAAPAVYAVLGLGYLIAMAAAVTAAVGLWRLWHHVAAEERRRSLGSPLSPGGMLSLFILQYVGLFILLPFWMGFTQKHLNRMWEAAH